MVRDAETHWQRLWRLYDEAVEREDDSARHSYLSGLQASDPDIAGEVRRLLAVRGRGEQFFANPPSIVVGAGKLAAKKSIRSDVSTHEDPLIGCDVAGRYVIDESIGRGGMGTVYGATQRSPRKRIAIKVMRIDALNAGAISRIRLEAAALARLHHRGIAQVFDSGTFEGGPTGFSHAFIAMERIDGPTLAEFLHSQSQPPSPEQLVEMLCRMCDAVEHAHQRGVIHCDLKPTNILMDVDSDGEQPQPKIVDFGVARIIDSDLTMTLARDLQELAGTLAYMSPERMSGDVTEPTLATDVYSLGVIGYEMLAKQLPVKVEATSVLLAIRMYQRATPRMLGVADERLRGDVETIIHKAIERDPMRRYRSAGELAAELRRWLRNEPIHARPATRAYHLRKFVQRNKAIVAVACLAAVALILGSVFSSWQALRATRQQTLAEQRFQDAWDAGKFLVFELDALLHNLPNATPARAAIVEQGVAMLDRLQASGNLTPQLRIDVTRGYLALMRVLGVPNRASIGDLEASLKVSAKALESVAILLRSDPDSRDARLLSAMVHADRGLTLAVMNRSAEACAEYNVVLDAFELLLRQDPGDLPMFVEFGRYTSFMMPAQFVMEPPFDTEQAKLSARIAELVLIPVWPAHPDDSIETATLHLASKMYKSRVLSQTGQETEGESGLLKLVAYIDESLNRLPPNDTFLQNCGDVHRLLASLRHKQQRREDAIASIDRALALYVRCTPAVQITQVAGVAGELYIQRAIILFELGSDREAVASLESAQRHILESAREDSRNVYTLRRSAVLALAASRELQSADVDDPTLRCQALREARLWLEEALRMVSLLPVEAQQDMRTTMGDIGRDLEALAALLAECD